MIELNQLEQLIYIAENKTISKAAKELLISQPALSRSMQKLESDLGVELFDHYKNKIVLNKNGELAVKHAQKIIKSIQTMINDVQDYDQSFHRISIATCSPAPMWDIEPLIKELYPQITIQTAVINKKDLLTKLKEKEYHLVITPEYIDDSQYFCIPYVEEEVPTVGHFEIKDVIDWVPYGICLVVICGLVAWQLRKERRKKREKKNDSL